MGNQRLLDLFFEHSRVVLFGSTFILWVEYLTAHPRLAPSKLSAWLVPSRPNLLFRLKRGGLQATGHLLVRMLAYDSHIVQLLHHIEGCLVMLVETTCCLPRLICNGSLCHLCFDRASLRSIGAAVAWALVEHPGALV